MKKSILFIFSFLFVLMLSGCNKIDEFNTIESITLKVGDVHNLVIDYDQTKKVNFEYSSYDSNIINLNQETITALSEGTTSIIITEKHSGIKKTIDIIVEKVNENIVKYTYEEINLWAYESSEEVSGNRDVLVYYDYKLPIIKNVEELNSFLELHNFANQLNQNLEGNFDKFDETFFKEKSIIVFATIKPQPNYRYVYNDLKVENDQLVLDVVCYLEGIGLCIEWPLTNVIIFDKEDVSKYNEILVELKRQN